MKMEFPITIGTYPIVELAATTTPRPTAPSESGSDGEAESEANDEDDNDGEAPAYSTLWQADSKVTATAPFPDDGKFISPIFIGLKLDIKVCFSLFYRSTNVWTSDDAHRCG